ncbi:MAG: Holliday junction resolvase RuvX, partial [Steroidobacteraceae bacterium]|nr:Holliday junction resolvase RuvX [Steroidobacteraceae bacterium]MDW8259746.1 Holliday junction resolvase RuvX [Gammaproteobacteria bacterium]
MAEAHGRAAPRIVLAFDFGLRRIGVASANTLTAAPRPLAAIEVRNGEPDWPAIALRVRDCGATVLVVGRPYNADGSAHALTAASDRFAAQ